jgi:hypothetical protein
MLSVNQIVAVSDLIVYYWANFFSIRMRGFASIPAGPGRACHVVQYYNQRASARGVVNGVAITKDSLSNPSAAV